MALVRTETLPTLQRPNTDSEQGLSADAADDLLRIDMEEAEVVLMEEREAAEMMLVEETALLEKVLLAKHQETVEKFLVTGTSGAEVSDLRAIGIEMDRKKAARIRLENESSQMESRLEREKDINQRRIDEFGRQFAQVKRTMDEGRKAMNARIMEKWEAVMKQTNEGIKWDASMVVESMRHNEKEMHKGLKEAEANMKQRFKRIDGPETLLEKASTRREAMGYRLAYEREKTKARLEQLLELLTPQDSGEYKPVGSFLGDVTSSERIRRAIAGLEVGVHTTKFVNIKAQWDQLEKELGFSDVSDRCTMIARALSRNPVVTVVDFTNASPQAINIAQLLENSQSLTSIVGFDLDDPEMAEELLQRNTKLMSVNETIRDWASWDNDQLQIRQAVTFYEDVVVTDFYRGGDPYLLFRYTGQSKCIVVFRPPEKKTILLKVIHCCTTSLGEINITLNKKLIPYDNSLTPIHNFGNTTIPISPEFLTDGLNELVILLDESSKGVYWLTEISVEM
jgi:hypothetical protein